MGTWSDVDHIFAEQHNVASAEQLRRVLTGGAVKGMVRRRRLIPLHRGVYQRGGVGLCEKGEAMAALLRCPDGSCLTGPLGLRLLGVDGFHGSSAFELLVPRRTHRPTGVSFRCRTNPSPAPTRMLGALRLAAPARMLVDSASPHFQLAEEQLWRGYDHGRWNGVFTTNRFLRELSASPPEDAGAARWWSIADERLLRLESPKERELDPLLRRFDPVPEVQVYVTPSRRVDFFWRRFRLAIEYLGGAAHRHPKGRVSDVARDVELAAVGIRTIPVTKEDLGEPDALLAYLRDVGVQRATELGVSPPILR